MESVGKILKKNRDLKKLTLSDVAKELKVSEEVLSNFENDNLQKDINIVFLIGHLRSYCSFLSLNQNEIIKDFKNQQIPSENNSFEIPRPRVEKNLIFSNKLISLTLILLIFSSFYFLFVEVDKPQREYAIIPDLPENYVSTVEEANLNSQNQN